MPISLPIRSFQFLAFALVICLVSRSVEADGKVIPPRDYKGSLEERAQEAIIIFHGSERSGGAKEDLILKIQVEGEAENFAWVVPFPREPKVAKEDPKLFKELFDYVETRKHRKSKGNSDSKSAPQAGAADKEEKVKILSRQVVGEFDVAVVQETEEGGLNPWLEREGFQKLDDADDVLKYYRDRGYVFACMKVSSKALAKQSTVESHPLRFTFLTSGRDGIYFPMKMTSLQEKTFDINLYVFYKAWLNDKLSQFGYRHRGFTLNYRDWDTRECEPNGGKSWSLPDEDAFLSSMSRKIPTITKLFQKLHPGEKYYLTNIQANNIEPEEIRQWSSDLWLFPYYTNRSMIPYDARSDGPAAAAYPHVETSEGSSDAARTSGSANAIRSGTPVLIAVVGVLGIVAVVSIGVFALVYMRSLRRSRISFEMDPSKPTK